jgi:hypothetical protein
MKYIIFVILILLSTTVNAQYTSDYKCSTKMKPFPPLGCNYEDAMCLCESQFSNNCHWQYICGGY